MYYSNLQQQCVRPSPGTRWFSSLSSFCCSPWPEWRTRVCRNSGNMASIYTPMLHFALCLIACRPWSKSLRLARPCAFWPRRGHVTAATCSKGTCPSPGRPGYLCTLAWVWMAPLRSPYRPENFAGRSRNQCESDVPRNRAKYYHYACPSHWTGTRISNNRPNFPRNSSAPDQIRGQNSAKRMYEASIRARETSFSGNQWSMCQEWTQWCPSWR